MQSETKFSRSIVDCHAWSRCGTVGLLVIVEEFQIMFIVDGCGLTALLTKLEVEE